MRFDASVPGRQMQLLVRRMRIAVGQRKPGKHRVHFEVALQLHDHADGSPSRRKWGSLPQTSFMAALIARTPGLSVLVERRTGSVQVDQLPAYIFGRVLLQVRRQLTRRFCLRLVGHKAARDLGHGPCRQHGL